MLNRIEIIGHLGRDPEVQTFENGTRMAKTSIATSESWTGKDNEEHTDTQWHNLVWFGKVVDVVEKYLKKGSKIFIEGKSTNRSWENEEGKKQYMHEVIVKNFIFLDAKSDSNSEGNDHYQEMASQAPQEPDDLPF